jgi:hypothetical protein
MGDRSMQSLERGVVLREHGFSGGLDLRGCATSSFRRGRVRDVLVGQDALGGSRGAIHEVVPRFIGQGPECDDCLDGSWSEHGGEPAIAVLRYGNVANVLVAAALPVDAVKECVYQDITSIQPKLGEEALDAMAGRAYQNAPDHGFMFGGVLSNAQEAGRTV